ncbi:hypothetical protein [Enterococcus faecium]|nr:hypothetical protein [Enterococcus faecium]
MRIACYGVRPNEIDFFEKLNIYHYDLSLNNSYFDFKPSETA